MSNGITIRIDCGNDAFKPRPEIEVARILRDLADRIEELGINEVFSGLNDANGNRVGDFSADDFTADMDAALPKSQHSISDDDLCSGCNCFSATSDGGVHCRHGFPAGIMKFSPDGYVVSCRLLEPLPSYEARVRAYERQGMTTSDAQGVVDAEDSQ